MTTPMTLAEIAQELREIADRHTVEIIEDIDLERIAEAIDAHAKQPSPELGESDLSPHSQELGYRPKLSKQPSPEWAMKAVDALQKENGRRFLNREERKEIAAIITAHGPKETGVNERLRNLLSRLATGPDDWATNGVTNLEIRNALASADSAPSFEKELADALRAYRDRKDTFGKELHRVDEVLARYDAAHKQP